MTFTPPLKPNFDSIPNALKAKPRWVTALKKRPYCSASINSLASTADPDTWSDFGLTHSAYEEGGKDGVGFVFNGDGIVGIDLDDCVVNGQPSDAAIAILKQAGCGYVEYSQSGTGLHAYGFICESERLLRRTLSVDGFCFFMFKTDQRAGKVMNIKTLPKLGVHTPPSVALAAFALALAVLALA